MQIPINTFGKTSLEVTRLGLGLAALGRPGYINLGHAEDLYYDYVVEAMEGRTHRMLDLAYEKGIRYFDVARSYGRAEQFLGSWLKEKSYSADDLVVGSKWGYTYTADWKVEADRHEIKEHSLSVLSKQWEESKVLQPHLRLYQIHSATFESRVLENSSVLNKLDELKQEGILIGLSLSGTNQADVLQAAQKIVINGQPLFDAVQVTYNILEQSSETVLQKVAENGMGIIVKEALANGRLTLRNNNPQFEACKALLEKLAQKYETGIDAIALAFVLSKPWAHIVLSGAAAKNHLQSNILATTITLTAEEIAQLAKMSMSADHYWSERKALKWN